MRRNPTSEVIDFISVYANALKLPDKVIDTAVQILKKYLDKKKNLTGRSVDLWAAATILLSCKVWGIPINGKQINDVANVTLHPHNKKREGYTLIYKLAREISIIIGLKTYNIIPLNDYLDVLIGRLSLPEEVRRIAYALSEDLHTISESPIASNQVLASTIIFLAAKIHGLRITEALCVKDLKVSEVALRNCKRRLLVILPRLKKYKSRYKYVEGDNEERKELSESIRESIPEGYNVRTTTPDNAEDITDSSIPEDTSDTTGGDTEGVGRDKDVGGGDKV